MRAMSEPDRRSQGVFACPNQREVVAVTMPCSNA